MPIKDIEEYKIAFMDEWGKEPRPASLNEIQGLIKYLQEDFPRMLVLQNDLKKSKRTIIYYPKRGPGRQDLLRLIRISPEHKIKTFCPSLPKKKRKEVVKFIYLAKCLCLEHNGYVFEIDTPNTTRRG